MMFSVFCVFQSSECNHTCVFWNSSMNGGTWSPSGCNVVESNAVRTVCSCSHLSSFAVLMALHDIEVRTVHCFITEVTAETSVCFFGLHCDTPLSTGQLRVAAHHLGGSVPLVVLPVPLHPDVLLDPLNQKSENHHPPAPMHQPLYCHLHLPHVHFPYREQGKYFCKLLQCPDEHRNFSDTCEFSRTMLSNSTATEWFMLVLKIYKQFSKFTFLFICFLFWTPFVPLSLQSSWLSSLSLCLCCTRLAVQWSRVCCIFSSWQLFAGCVWRAYSSSGWLSWSLTPALKLFTWWLEAMAYQL